MARNETHQGQYDAHGYSLAWKDLPRIHDVRYFDRLGVNHVTWPGLQRIGDMILGLDGKMRDELLQIVDFLPKETGDGTLTVAQEITNPVMSPTTNVYDFSLKQKAQDTYTVVDGRMIPDVTTGKERKELTIDMAPTPSVGDYLMFYDNKFLEVRSSAPNGPDQNRVVATYGSTLPQEYPLLWRVIADTGLAGQVNPYDRPQ